MAQTRVDYLSYMESPQWRAFRKRVLDRDHHCCTNCGIEHFRARLEVHHKTYERLGQERLEDCITLCETCHSILDGERRRGAWTRRWQKRYDAFGRKAGLTGGAAELALATWIFETTP